MGWMTADDHWWLGWREGFLMGMLPLLIPIAVCYIAMTIVFLRKGEVAVGTLCTVFLVLSALAPFGVLIALVFGWRNASRWNIKAFMALWTGLVVMVILHCGTIVVLKQFDGETLRPLIGRSL
jgi:hypothetical protein